MIVPRAALRSVVLTLALEWTAACVNACSLDLAKLQHGRDAEISEPASPAPRGQFDGGSLYDAPDGTQMAEGLVPPLLVEPPCGVVGRPCCQPDNACAFGACLRGRCSTYGGLYAQERGCGPSVCATRNAYTAGCSCPEGFAAVEVRQDAYACPDGTDGENDLALCTTEIASASAWMGVWVSERGLPGCTDACLVPNSATGDCTCPRGAVPLRVGVEDMSASCPDGEEMLGLCLNADDTGSNFRGAYVLGASGSARACVANPVTGTCSCPASSTAQEVTVGKEHAYFCSE